MKTVIMTAAAMAALTMTAGTASAAKFVCTGKTCVSPIQTLDPLPVTPANTSSASGFDNNTGKNQFYNGILAPAYTSGKSAVTFIDDYTFYLGGNYETTLGGSFYNNTGGSNIANIDLVLYQGIPTQATPSDGTQIDTTGLTPVKNKPGLYSYSFTDLLMPQTSYYLQADVKVPAGYDGKYTVSAIATPVSAVPEPGTWLLMIGGVAMIGGMLRYTRRQQGLAFNVA